MTLPESLSTILSHQRYVRNHIKIPHTLENQKSYKFKANGKFLIYKEVMYFDRK